MIGSVISTKQFSGWKCSDFMRMLLLRLTFASLSQFAQVIGNLNCKLLFPLHWLSSFNHLVTLAENFHLTNYFLKVSVLILTYLQPCCVVTKANVIHRAERHKRKSTHLNEKKKKYICYYSSDRSQVKRCFGDENQCSTPSRLQMRTLRWRNFRGGRERADLKRQKIHGFCFATHRFLKPWKYISVLKYLIYLSKWICVF